MLESTLWGIKRLTEQYNFQGHQGGGHSVERLVVSRNRNLSKLFCVWPGFPHCTRRLYQILREKLELDHFNMITRVHDVIQESDGRYRLDLFIDDRTGEADHIASVMQRVLPQRWLMRYNISYRVRHDQSRGVRRIGRLNSQPLGFAAATWNVRSFGPKHLAVRWFCKVNAVSILALQETRCREYSPRVAGYIVFSVPASSQGTVGLALAIRKELPSTLLDRHDNFIICEIRMANCIWIVANVYFPSGSLRHPVIREFEHALERQSNRIAQARILILGDFNRGVAEVDQLCWRWAAPVTRLSTRGSSGSFHGFRSDLEPTSIDHIIMGPVPQVPPRASVLRGWSDSDHWPVLVEVPSDIGELPRPEPKTLYSRTMSEASRLSFLSDNRWDVLMDQMVDCSANRAAPLLLDTFNAVGRSVGVVRETTGKEADRRKLSHKTKSVIRRRTCALNRYLASGSEVDKESYLALKVAASSSLREDAQAAMRKHLEELRHSLGARRSREAWKWIKKFMKPLGEHQVNSLPAIYNSVGELETSIEGRSLEWLSYYRRLFNDVTSHSRDAAWWQQFRAAQQPNHTVLDPLADPLQVVELLNVLKKCSNGKAPGMDKIVPEWFKLAQVGLEQDGTDAQGEHSNKIAKALMALYNLMLTEDTIPDCWQTAEIVSIHKSGDPQRPENYRGIALIPVGLKILCSLVIERFNRMLDEHQLLRREQAGFRSREECVGQIASLMEIATRRRTWGESTYVAFIDFKKAYDMVPHEALFAKLEAAGFDGNFMSFLKTLYRSSFMTPRGTNQSVPVMRGLRQGCPMSPSLFNFFINDLFDSINEFRPEGIFVPGLDGDHRCPGLMFADDVVLLGASEKELKESLNHLQRWAERWEMEVGVTKCAIMLISPDSTIDPIGKLQSEGPWELHDQAIPLVRHYRYLGFEFTDDLLPERHITINMEKATAAFGRCQRFLTNRKVPLRVRALTYKTMVLPVLSWGVELLPLNKAKFACLSRVQSRQLRVLSGLQPNSTNGCPMTIGREFNIPPLWVRAASARIRLYKKAPILKTWLHLLVAQRCRLPRQGTRPWTVTTVRWLSQTVNRHGPAQFPLHRWIRQILWNHAIAQSSTLSMNRYETHNLVESRRYLEYGEYDLQHQRGLYYLFRMRTGSFTTAERLAQMRLIDPMFLSTCPFCGDNQPETVAHILCSCPRWAQQRREVFHNNNFTNGRMDEAMASVLLLGGEIRGDQDDGIQVGPIFIDGHPITLMSMAFLDAIMTERTGILYGLPTVSPPRVNALQGTTVLQYGTELAGPGGSEPQGVLVGTNPTYPDLDSDLLRSVHSRNL